VDTQRRLASTDMNTVFSHQYRPSRQRRRFAAETKSGWLELGDAAILYFGVTLLPLLVVILLYLAGVIG